MKKISMITASALMSVAMLVGCGSTGLKDGSYTGEGTGNNGPIKVTVTVAEEKISAVTVDAKEETPDYWSMVEGPITEAAVGKTSADDIDAIDAVSGATNSSNGVKEAIKAALDQAK
jgi:fumarate reductase flavoprotein subunit